MRVLFYCVTRGVLLYHNWQTSFFRQKNIKIWCWHNKVSKKNINLHIKISNFKRYEKALFKIAGYHQHSCCCIFHSKNSNVSYSFTQISLIPLHINATSAICNILISSIFQNHQRACRHILACEGTYSCREGLNKQKDYCTFAPEKMCQYEKINDNDTPHGIEFQKQTVVQ